MSRRVDLVEPRFGDCEHLAANLRAADRAEVEASTGSPDMLACIHASVDHSLYCWSAVDQDGRLVAMLGVVAADLLGGLGVPWMLGTDLVEQQQRALVRLSRAYIPRMRQALPKLVNYVDARNERAIRFLRHAGFYVAKAEPHGPLGLPFHPFIMKA